MGITITGGLTFGNGLTVSSPPPITNYFFGKVSASSAVFQASGIALDPTNDNLYLTGGTLSELNVIIFNSIASLKVTLDRAKTLVIWSVKSKFICLCWSKFINLFESKISSKLSTCTNKLSLLLILNGFNSMEEFDNRPFEICPICLRKLYTVISLKGFNDLSNARINNPELLYQRFIKIRDCLIENFSGMFDYEISWYNARIDSIDKEM